MGEHEFEREATSLGRGFHINEITGPLVPVMTGSRQAGHIIHSTSPNNGDWVSPDGVSL